MTVVDQRQKLPELKPGQRKLAWAIALGMFLTLPAGFVLIGPSPNWHRLDLFFALCWLTLASGFGTLMTRRRFFFDSADACTLVALAVLGPLPAFVTIACMELVQWGFERFRLIALAVNIGSFGWGILATSAFLEFAGVGLFGPTSGIEPYVLLFLAGLLLLVVQYLLCTVPLLMYDGGKIGSVLVHELVRPAPVEFLTVGLGVTATYAYWRYGIWAASAALVANLIVWQALAPWLISRLSPGDVSTPPTAARARAIADILGLARERSRVIQEACGTGDGQTPTLHRLSDFEAVMNTVMYANEKWDGVEGSPGTLEGADIPIEARILAVARAWHDLSARGLTDQAAMAHLTAKAGRDFDPEVVAAAARAASAGLVLIKPQLRLSQGWATG